MTCRRSDQSAVSPSGISAFQNSFATASPGHSLAERLSRTAGPSQDAAQRDGFVRSAPDRRRRDQSAEQRVHRDSDSPQSLGKAAGSASPDARRGVKPRGLSPDNRHSGRDAKGMREDFAIAPTASLSRSRTLAVEECAAPGAGDAAATTVEVPTVR